jgi:pentatricopeptide repeat protein
MGRLGQQTTVEFVPRMSKFRSRDLLPRLTKQSTDTNEDLDLDDAEAPLDFLDGPQEEEDDNDTELVLQFLEYCQDTPAGEMELDDAELLRGVLNDFPEELYEDNHETDIEIEIIMETLLYRLLDEWALANKQLDGNHNHDHGGEEIDNDYLAQKEAVFRPIPTDFENVIGAWYRSNNPDKVVRVLNILSDQRQIVLHGSGETAVPDARPTLKTIEYVLEVLARSKERGIEKRAAMIVNSLASDFNLEPDAKITGLLIQILAKSRAPGAAHDAEKLLREAVVKFPPDTPDGLNDIEVFNTIVTAWAKSRKEDGPQRAQDLIVFMDKLGSTKCAPNSRTFTSLIDAYAQTNEWMGVRNAERILNNVLDLYLDGRDDLEPNVATWTIVISAYSRLCKNPKSNRRNLIEAGRRAGMLLKRMEKLHSNGRLSAGPDAITYKTVFNACAFSKDKENIDEAGNLLDEMNERYLDGDDSMKPSIHSIKILIDAWIKLGAMDKAEDIWEKYEDTLEGSEMSKKDLEGFYLAFLHGYCQQGDARRAKVYLDLMLDEDIEPNISCYDRLIDSYVKQGGEDCARKSQEVLKLVETRRQLGALVPNERVYTTFIRALIKGKVPALYKKADLMLKRMQSLSGSGLDDVAPSIYTYNVCLHACSESATIEGVDKAEAFQTAGRIFTGLQRELDPDHLTFGNMLRCANLLPPSSEKKERFVKATFKLCCEKGLLNTMNLRDLRNVSEDELWTSLTNLPRDFDIKSIDHVTDCLPSDWSRNTLQKESFRTDIRSRAFSGNYRSR